MSSWALEPTDKFKSKFRRYEKRHPVEAGAALQNLDTYKVALDAGTPPTQVKAGFIHPEPQGVVAIDQSGTREARHQTRLYIYAYVDEHTVYLITIGDKNTQRDDLADCRDFVRELRRRHEER